MAAITGTSGNDRLAGSAGNELIRGLGGKDHLYGGDGNDRLTGGRDADWFIFDDDDGRDMVLDFSRRQGDRLVLDDENRFATLDSNRDGRVDGGDRDVARLDGGLRIRLDDVDSADDGRVFVADVRALFEEDFKFRENEGGAGWLAAAAAADFVAIA